MSLSESGTRELLPEHFYFLPRYNPVQRHRRRSIRFPPATFRAVRGARPKALLPLGCCPAISNPTAKPLSAPSQPLRYRKTTYFQQISTAKRSTASPELLRYRKTTYFQQNPPAKPSHTKKDGGSERVPLRRHCNILISARAIGYMVSFF